MMCAFVSRMFIARTFCRALSVAGLAAALRRSVNAGKYLWHDHRFLGRR